MIIRTSIFFCTISLAFAALINEVRFRDTWLKYYDGQQDHTTYAGAMISCQKRRGWLAMPKDKNFNSAVANVAQGRWAFIGGTDILGEGRYEWNDGDAVEWANWYPGEPNNGGKEDGKERGNEDCKEGRNEEDCMNINIGGQGKWNDRPCEYLLGYVCQIPDNKALPSPTRKFTVYSGRNATSYFKAKDFCVKRRSRLAFLENNDHLNKMMADIDDSSLTKHWVTLREDVTACSTVSGLGLSTANCLQPLPVICEQVAPYGLEISKEEVTLEVGSDFRIDCTASGVPVPQVKWYRDGAYVPHQKRGTGQSSLELENVTSEDAGMYVCKATNEVGRVRRRTEGYSFIGITSILG